ncbi:MAG: glutamate-cysteine ligase family protein [Pseudomonadota bacterium]
MNTSALNIDVSPATNIAPLSAFQGCGLEIEYMIVDRTTGAVRPIADQLLCSGLSNTSDAGSKRESLAWSNELVSHVIELKNTRPIANLRRLREGFQNEVRAMNRRLESFNACLMPTGMHPSMNAQLETCLWTKSDRQIYDSYQRIFDCKTPGWANLQSLHINLPFADDKEFARLHAAIRLMLPILPALAASSPILNGASTGFMDYRLEAYRNNARIIPSITGHVIPETVSSRVEYETMILAPMYREISPFDPDAILQHEWLNSRGAIARFDRNAIEIRLIDVQECPYVDVAIAALTADLVKALYDQHLAPFTTQQFMETKALEHILLACIQDAELAVIDNPAYLALLGYPASSCTAGELWRHIGGYLLKMPGSHSELWTDPLSMILRHGPLARRIVRAVGWGCSPERLRAVYRQLSECLQQGGMFI